MGFRGLINRRGENRFNMHGLGDPGVGEDRHYHAETKSQVRYLETCLVA